MDPVHNKILSIRQKADLTQQAMSDMLKIPVRTIENWEGNKSSPPQYVIELIEYRLKNYTPPE